MLIGDRYRVLRLLKRGGMSRVFLAEDMKLRMKWVIKVITCDKPYMADAVISEANVLRSIRHPNLVRIMDIFKWEENACLVMEYVEGRNLADLIRDNPALVQRNAYSFSLSLMHALSALHDRRKPVIYRDMKPENIIVRPDLTLCLIDFGTSKELLTGKEDRVSLGTRSYASPEQFRGISDVRSDIYSLGKTMERMAGRDPDRAIKGVVRKAVNPDPDKRYQTVKEMEKDLIRRKSMKIRISVAAAVLTCIVTVVSALIFGYNERKKTALVADIYRKTVEAGNESLYNKDYSGAEQNYTKAIVEINGYEEEAYLRLLSLYRKAEAPLDGLSRMDYYIDSGYGNTDRMDELLTECGLTAFEDLRDYKKACTYFQKADKASFPEAGYLLNISEYLSSFDKNTANCLNYIRDFRDYTDSVPDIERKIKCKMIYTDMCIILSEEAGESTEGSAVLRDGYDQGKKLMKLIDENGTGGENELQSLNMMSAICRLLGEKFPDRKKEYFKEALSYMDMAEMIEPGDEDPMRYVSMAKLYQGIGDDRNAGIFYRKAETYGGNANAYTEHMKYLESKGKYKELQSVYMESLSINGIQETKEFQKITKRLEKMELIKG
ncbi:MAG: serine/threonine protein kinase [Lachnospiraceae bacterium]|nr:serine/threonine protein kinase [Lachnospiraceae bacterium]